MLNDVFVQLEDPQARQGAQIDENVAEALVHEVLGLVEPVRHDSSIERLFEDIDAYVGEASKDPEEGEGSGVQRKDKEVVEDSSSESDDEDDGDDEEDDEDSSDDDDSPDYTSVNEKFERVGHQLLLKGSST